MTVRIEDVVFGFLRFPSGLAAHVLEALQALLDASRRGRDA